jgi:hypothetical protein
LSHELNAIAVGGIDGKIEFWDFEQRNKVSTLVPSLSGDEISCVKF